MSGGGKGRKSDGGELKRCLGRCVGQLIADDVAMTGNPDEAYTPALLLQVVQEDKKCG